MKKDQTCSFPVSKLAYEKGFNWMNTDGFSDPDQTLMYFFNVNTGQYELRSQEYAYFYPEYSNTSISYYAPTQTMLARFLREEKNILIEIQIDRTSTPKFIFDVWKYGEFGNWVKAHNTNWCLYKTYEEATEQALLLSLKRT